MQCGGSRRQEEGCQEDNLFMLCNQSKDWTGLYILCIYKGECCIKVKLDKREDKLGGHAHILWLVLTFHLNMWSIEINTPVQYNNRDQHKYEYR